jgi:NAD(P)-dependent dehydrogenase (short-subunit alcohol dehydrogenase family)
MYKSILITGAGSGFGEGTAIGLAKKGHTVIAAAESWPQVTALRLKAESLGLSSLRVEKLDLLEPHDVTRAVGWEFDVLFNNAGVGEGGPISEIPMDLVRRNFEINVFAPLALTQRVVKKWVKAKKRGKVVFTSSVLGVVSPPMVGAYSATKHAVQAIAEAMQDELRPFGIQVQTINPGPFLTGFNETMVEAAYRWLDDAVTFTPRVMMKEVTDGLLAKPEGRLDPNDMIARMIELIPDQNGPFRNIFPEASHEWFRQYEKAMPDRTI